MQFSKERKIVGPAPAGLSKHKGRNPVKLKRLLALLMAFGLVASACGGSDSEGDDAGASADDDAMEDEGSDDEPAATTTTAAPTTAGEAAAEIATDYGVTDDVIRVGMNADLSGPFSSLVSEIVTAQEVYWEWVNENGGIAGRQVEVVVLDSGYATDKGIENYNTLADESDEGVAMISESTGSPINAAIAEDALDDNMLVIPLSWASLWPDPEFGASILEKGTTYCIEAINGVSWLKDRVEGEGKEAKLAIISRPGEYGADGHAGAEIAAEELGIEVVYNAKGEVSGDDRTAVISQLVSSGATMVWTTLTPGELADVFGNAIAQGFEATWSGNNPSFSYPALLSTDLAPAFDEYYFQSGYAVPFNGDDSEGMQELVREMTARRPDANLSDAYIIGWQEGYMVQTVLERAAANGDMTRAGLVQASKEITVDFKGLSPNQSWGGDYNDIVVRESYIYDVDATAFDLQPLSAGTGSSGLIVIDGPYVSETAANYVFDKPCITPGG